jgi:hypothetical protein
MVSTLREFLDAGPFTETVAFVDSDALIALQRSETKPPCPVIASCSDTLQTAIGWLADHPWLSHVVSSSLFTNPMGAEHLANVTATLTRRRHPRLLDWLGPEITGRRVRLVHAGRRVDRLERMSGFFTDNGVSPRTIQSLRDAAEELLTNAFYDAPVAAGAVSKAISRTQDVLLPDDSACEMVYGCRQELAVVRVRDPFGSLSRARLVEVLTRCARTDMRVEVDETMGGAGLGLWRIVSAASFVGVSVVNQRHTEFLVGMLKRSPGPKPFALHLFFKEDARHTRVWESLSADPTAQLPDVSQPIAIIPRKASESR